MQRLAEICIDRPVFATVLILTLVVVGAFGYTTLGLDRFPKPDLIRQQHATTKSAQDLSHRFDLVGQMFDSLQSLQAEQLIETTEQAEASMFLMQPQIAKTTRSARHPKRFRPKRHCDSRRRCPMQRQIPRFQSGNFHVFHPV